MLAVLVVVALGAYAYLWWWGQTEDHGYLDTVPALRDASENASEAVRPRPVTPGTPAAPGEQVPASQTYRTYENSEFGFSFSYPDNWTVSSNSVDPSTTLCLRVTDSTGGCLATVTFEMESVNMSLEKVLDALRADLRAGRIAESSRTIAGESATQFKVSNYPAGQEGDTRAAAFLHETEVYTITATMGQEAVYDRLTSSFKFQ